MSIESSDSLVESAKAECDGLARKVWPLLSAPFVHIGPEGARCDVDNLHGVIVSGHPNAARGLMACLSALAGDTNELGAWKTFEWFAKGVAAEAGYTGEADPSALGRHIRELRLDAEKWRACKGAELDQEDIEWLAFARSKIPDARMVSIIDRLLGANAELRGEVAALKAAGAAELTPEEHDLLASMEADCSADVPAINGVRFVIERLSSALAASNTALAREKVVLSEVEAQRDRWLKASKPLTVAAGETLALAISLGLEKAARLV